MSDRPIIFSSPMMRALLEGRKTQTRRVIVEQPEDFLPVGGAEFVHDRWCWLNGSDGSIIHPFKVAYAPGDRLWVKEPWRTAPAYDDLKPSEMGGDESIKYEADGRWESWGWGDVGCTDGGRYRHARFMPRWASRLTLTVTDVRVQRLQEITPEDAREEGLQYHYLPPNKDLRGMDQWRGSTELPWTEYEDEAFADLWNSLHGPDAWDANPWVAAISFTVEQRNIDA